MIHTNRTVTVGNQESIIDSPIILYRGDRQVEVEFTLNGNKFTFTNGGNVIKSTNATHGQLVINTPTGENMFSEITTCNEGKVVFLITKEMIDELVEIGFYSFQIRLFDESQVSRVTIPPVFQGIDIRNPIAAEDETNLVDIGLVDYAVVQKDEYENLATFLPDGSYNKTDWESRGLITEAKLDKIEDALYTINANMEASDLSIFNRIESINQNVNRQITEFTDEADAEIEEFERSVNTNVEQFKTDTNAAMTAHKNEVSEELESVNTQLDHNEKNNKYISVKNFGAIGDGVVDDTQAIQNAIDYGNENGLVVLLNEGVYLTKSLSLYKNTSIVGENRTKSILKIHGDINDNLINLVDVNETHINLENFTIDGNKENITAESVNAIYTEQNTDTHHTIKNLIIRNVKGNGIVMSRGENIVTDLYIHHCDGYGIVHVGSDNLFTNIRCAWNWKGGVYEGGASSRWVSCKTFVNGEADNINKTEHNNEGYGFDIRDSKGATFMACEAQENYSSGFRIMSYKQAVLSSCRSDCNGMINKEVESESERVLKCYGVEILSIQDCKIDITCDDFRFSSGLTNLQWQYGALAIRSTECTNNIINISSSNMINDIAYGWNEDSDDEWEYYTNFVTNYKNSLILNQSILSSTILNSALRLKKDRFNTTRISFGDITSDDFTWVASHETDDSFRLRLYCEGDFSDDYLQLFTTGGVCIGKENIMLGFFGKSPVIQQTSTNDATDLSSAISLVNNLKAILIDLGLCK